LRFPDYPDKPKGSPASPTKEKGSVMRSRDALSHDRRLLMNALWRNCVRLSTKKEKKVMSSSFFFYQALQGVEISYWWRLLVSIPYTK
jgi:hypothetical protein